MPTLITQPDEFTAGMCTCYSTLSELINILSLMQEEPVLPLQSSQSRSSHLFNTIDTQPQLGEEDADALKNKRGQITVVGGLKCIVEGREGKQGDNGKRLVRRS
jgi:hypothetical protein